jgi:NAD-dependent dihydropyrimidine dehydrogenase PreA subunit
MFRLKLDGRQCLACGICMDVCHPRAIALRLAKASPVEGNSLTFLLLETTHNSEMTLQMKGTFPYLARPELCDGCGDCIEQCPAGALVLLAAPETAHSHAQPAGREATH